MKSNKQCPKCTSLKIGFIQEQLDRSGEYDSSYTRKVGHQNVPGIFWGESEERVGSLEALVCTACGYFESYVSAPESVPWDELVDFRWVNAEPPDSSGPFR